MRRFAGIVVGALATSLGLHDACADEKSACIDADTAGQELRLWGRWREAEARFQACFTAGCPSAVYKDCAARYDELRRAIPTVQVAAQRPDGTDTVDARLLLDDRAAFGMLPTTAIEIDPGEHVIRVEHDAWTAPEQRIVIREGEKNRRLLFRFGESRRSPGDVREGRPESQASPGRGVDVLGIGLAAGGGLATAVGATFFSIGLVQRDNLLQSACASSRTCSPADVSRIDRNYEIGGIVAGIGLVALGVAIGELAMHPRPATGLRAGEWRLPF